MTVLKTGHIRRDDMPVIFSEEQREQIRQQIKEHAKELFSQKSVRKTGVAELAKCVGIAKGTFYHFIGGGAPADAGGKRQNPAGGIC